MFNFNKYFVPMSRYMAAQTQIMQLTAKKDSLEADIAELETTVREETLYAEELLRDITELKTEAEYFKERYFSVKDYSKIQAYIITLLVTFVLGELFVILALI